MTVKHSPFDAFDYECMARAIRLARKGWYSTHPNPRVGCVIVKGGRIVGQGFHRKAGEPHAERNALADAGADAQGATAYVTLEPCCHQGRTPPCTDGLIEAGIQRVVMAMKDPNPRVAGQGEARLQAAGIQVDSGLLETQAQQLNPGFIKRMTEALPFVRCKLAMSLDGRTAMASGESKWITSAQSRQDVQRYRASASAVMTGSGTVQADNPSMNVRLSADELSLDADLEVRQPLRVVLDRQLKTPADANVLTLPGDVMLFCDEQRLPVSRHWPENISVTGVASVDGQLDLYQVLEHLARQEINEVLLETGATLAGTALQAGLIDELVIYSAPHIMGDSARGLFHLPDLQQMSDRIDLQIQDVRRLGDDLRITAVPGLRSG